MRGPPVTQMAAMAGLEVRALTDALLSITTPRAASLDSESLHKLADLAFVLAHDVNAAVEQYVEQVYAERRLQAVES